MRFGFGEDRDGSYCYQKKAPENNDINLFVALTEFQEHFEVLPTTIRYIEECTVKGVTSPAYYYLKYWP